MNKVFDTLKTLRAATINLVAGLNIDQFNKVPNNFLNNIGWNLGHIVSAQQGVCYKRGNAPIVVSESFFEIYKPGTKPERLFNEDEMEEVKTLMLSTVYQLEQDYKDGLFTAYPTFTTRYGVEISSIEDAIKFLPFHDGLHMGYIMALKRAIR